MKLICFDLEGPLSPQDNAYEVMGLVNKGHQIFEVISRYDDLLTLQNRKNYEPGDTLSLIVPFLLKHRITKDDVTKISNKAKIVDGARELISMLKKEGWKVYIISTSYEQHAFNIGAKLGVPQQDIACTRLALNLELDDNILNLIDSIEKKILKMGISDDDAIMRVLDKFFFVDLPKAGYDVFRNIKVVGGQRKVDAMLKFASLNNVGLGDVIAVGDSITDFKMLETVRKNGGLAVVFNGNKYAIPYANVGLASTDIRFLHILTSNLENIHDVVKKLDTNRDIPEELLTPEIRSFLDNSRTEPPSFDYLVDATEDKINNVIAVHKKFRELVRGGAAKLG